MHILTLLDGERSNPYKNNNNNDTNLQGLSTYNREAMAPRS